MASTSVSLPKDAASQIASSATGDVAATNVQSAIAELASEKRATAFVPTTAGDWSPTPANIQDALDQLAARIKALEP